jgi:hypothetical protein
MSKRAQGRIDPSVRRPVTAPQPGRPPRRLRQLRAANDNLAPAARRVAFWAAITALTLAAGIGLAVLV